MIAESDEEIWKDSHDSEDEDRLGVGIRTFDEQPSLPTFNGTETSERAQVLCRWFVGFLLLLQARYYIGTYNDSEVSLCFLFHSWSLFSAYDLCF